VTVLTEDQAARLHASNIRVLRQRIREHDEAPGHGPGCDGADGLRQELADELELLERLQAGDCYPHALAGDTGHGPITTEGTNMTTTGETLTHRGWLDWAGDCIGQLQDLYRALDTMAAQIAADGGDQAQITSIRNWQGVITDVVGSGQQMVEQVNSRQIPVGEAVAGAGGSENTPHKEYADEARTG